MRLYRFLSVLAVAGTAFASVPAIADEWVMACAEGSPPCAIDGTRMVQYGANGRFAYGVATNRVVCANETFGDPIPGVAKACWYKKTASEQSLAAALASRDNQLAQLTAQVGQLTARVTQLTGTVDALQRENRDLKSDLRKANAQIDKLQTELKKAQSGRSLPPINWSQERGK